MKRVNHALFDGAIQANKIGSFVKGGETFHVIRPGYCSQAKRRLKWTQIVHEDVPIFEAKVDVDFKHILAQFDSLWDRTIGEDRDLFQKALANCKRERRRKFKDGKTGETVAPSVTRDGRGAGRRYPT